MRKSLVFKMLLRTPVKTLLTFVLIAAASFSLFSRVTDYVVTSRETKHARGLYHAVAYLDNEIPDIPIITTTVTGWSSAYYATTYETEDKPWLTKEQEEEFQALPGVTLADRRYMTAGLVEDYKRMDYGGRCLFEGTYRGYEEGDMEDHISLKFDDVTVIAAEEGPQIGTSFTMEATPLGDTPYAASPYTRAFYDGLREGSRCLVLANNTGILAANGSGITFPYEVGEGALRVLDGQPDNYLETPSFARQKGWADAINYNRYTHDIVYTSDMRAIPQFNEQSLTVSQGRLLTAGDADACVVSEEFLSAHGLSVGDCITIRLGDRLCHYVTLADEGEDVPDFANSARLTIVGAYSGGKEETSYNGNKIYVPASLLPVDVPESYEPVPGEFSVFVENADDIERFHEAVEQFAEKTDLRLEYSDRGWLDVKDSLRMGELGSLLTTVMYVAGAILALILAAYFYIGRHRKTYAIMRALGVPARTAAKSAATPFAAVTAAAAPAGGVAGLLYERKTTGQVVVPGTILLCLFSELLLVVLLIAFFLHRMKKTPPLELLQETPAGMRTDAKVGRMAEISPPCSVNLHLERLPASQEWKPEKTYGAARHTAAYALRHMRRSIGKTALSVALTAVLAAGVGMFVLARFGYQSAFHELGVKAKLSDYAFTSVVELSKSPLVKDFYCHGSFGVRIRGCGDAAPMTLTSDVEYDLGSECSVDFADGFDLSAFDGTGQVCLVGEELADRLGVSPGDEIGMLSDILYAVLTGSGGEKAAVDGYKTYKVIGVAKSGDKNVSNGVFLGVRGDVQRLFSMDFPIESCRFTLADNTRLEELDAFLQEKREAGRLYAPNASYNLDSGELANIRRIRDLLEALFPAAVAAAVLIGMFGSILAILQSAKEAAILRILGVTKRRARCMLALEQVILCAAGIVLVAGGLYLGSPGLFARSSATLASCFALYFLGCACGACAAAVQTTRRKLLELLQEKE